MPPRHDTFFTSAEQAEKSWNKRYNPFENPGHDIEEFYQDEPRA